MLSDALPQNRRSFIFSRTEGAIELQTSRKGMIAKRTVVVFTDARGSVEIDLSNEDIDTLKQNCPEIELVGE